MNNLFAPLLAASALLSLAFPAFGGWMEADKDGRKTFFSDGKIKDAGSGGDTWNVFDTRSGQLLLVDDERKIYTREKIDAFCRAIKHVTDQAMSRMSPEERKVMEQMTGTAGQGKSRAKNPTVTVSSPAPGGTIAGFDTEKFLVKVDGKLYEEVWIAPAAPVLKELDVKGLQRYQKEMSGCLEHAGPMGIRAGGGPEESREYEKLLRRGWVMRTIQYDEKGNQASTTGVDRLEKRELPPSEFLPPASYRQVSVDRFLTGD